MNALSSTGAFHLTFLMGLLFIMHLWVVGLVTYAVYFQDIGL